jgi:hypothetical protein
MLQGRITSWGYVLGKGPGADRRGQAPASCPWSCQPTQIRTPWVEKASAEESGTKVFRTTAAALAIRTAANTATTKVRMVSSQTLCFILARSPELPEADGAGGLALEQANHEVVVGIDDDDLAGRAHEGCTAQLRELVRQGLRHGAQGGECHLGGHLRADDGVAFPGR